MATVSPRLTTLGKMDSPDAYRKCAESAGGRQFPLFAGVQQSVHEDLDEAAGVPANGASGCF